MLTSIPCVREILLYPGMLNKPVDLFQDLFEDITVAGYLR